MQIRGEVAGLVWNALGWIYDEATDSVVSDESDRRQAVRELRTALALLEQEVRTPVGIHVFTWNDYPVANVVCDDGTLWVEAGEGWVPLQHKPIPGTRAAIERGENVSND